MIYKNEANHAIQIDPKTPAEKHVRRFWATDLHVRNQHGEITCLQMIELLNNLIGFWKKGKEFFRMWASMEKIIIINNTKTLRPIFLGFIFKGKC